MEYTTLFFSGTGNSGWVAGRIAEGIGGECVSMNRQIRAGRQARSGAERLVFVTPTYAWRIPRAAERWIEAGEFAAGAKAWFVMTCGDGIGHAEKYVRRLCERKGLACMGVMKVIMPENYIAMFEAPDMEEAGRIIDAAEPKVAEAIDHIRADRPFPAAAVSVMDRMLTTVANPVFYRAIVKADAFRVTEACTGCGKCERECVLNNIRITEGKPAWGKECTHCMACICGCPAHAIEYGNKSVGKVRYQCPR